MTTLSQQQLFELYRNLPTGCVYTINDVYAWIFGGQFPRPLSAHPPNYKTKLCKHFQRGYCRYGRHCNFAHGVQDLSTPLLDDTNWNCDPPCQPKKQDSPREAWKVNPEPVAMLSNKTQALLAKYQLEDPLNLDDDSYTDWCNKVRNLVFSNNMSTEDGALLDALCGRRQLPELTLEENNLLKSLNLEDPTNLNTTEYLIWTLQVQNILAGNIVPNEHWKLLEAIADRRFC